MTTSRSVTLLVPEIAITGDPMITPTKETIDTKLFGLAVLTPEVMKKYNDVWTELKSQ